MPEWSAGEFRFPVIDIPPSARGSVDAVVNFLVQYLVDSGRILPEHAPGIVCSILRRESLGSTGIGRGVALPHYKCDHVEEVIGVVGVSQSGISWPAALDDRPVHRVSLLVTPSWEPALSLRALQVVSQTLRDL
jgi:PTS system fructose-specific IIA component/PTS system nitrogen regulatory IIA component